MLTCFFLNVLLRKLNQIVSSNLGIIHYKNCEIIILLIAFLIFQY